ncbi:hypothetical protein M107_5132 [Bacteroides fragilis str. 3725 D9(v)]|nr:hypothetical protein M107_5132 [Bacteroides fragilis str. 3725 D9(v)]
MHSRFSIRVWLIMPMLYPLSALKSRKTDLHRKAKAGKEKNGFQCLTNS